MNVDSLMRAVGVRRWHTEPQIGDETDGHHSAVVALIADYLADNEGIPMAERYYLLREALRHDLGEYWTGDLPAPAKKALTPELLAQLSSTERHQRAAKLQFHDTPLVARQVQMLALADTLAAAVHCARQALMGNREGRRILMLLCEYLKAQLTADCVLLVSTQMRATQLMRECAMIADSDAVIIHINTLETRVTCQEPE